MIVARPKTTIKVWNKRPVTSPKVIKTPLRFPYKTLCDIKYKISGPGIKVKAIEENVRKKVHKKTKEIPWHTEQDNQADWILMDYSNIILHIFQEETRNFYNLEELWGDAKKVSYN